ncbi:hypothetical protein V5O48_014019 [Marasmius crinis-equi]|uniref:Uncharacterized protein n=1 Tax=Marasmius crinis-equi TaxID=585013 RepID=A0ABR3EYU9_9AGAR
MAPPKLYKTKAEKTRAVRDKSARYYERNSEAIKARKRARRAENKRIQIATELADQVKEPSTGTRTGKKPRTRSKRAQPPPTSPANVDVSSSLTPLKTYSDDHLRWDSTTLEEELRWGQDCFYSVNRGLYVDSEDEAWYQAQLNKAVVAPEYGDDVWEIRALHNRLNMELGCGSNGEKYLFDLHQDSLRWWASVGDLQDADCPLRRAQNLFCLMLEKTCNYRREIAEWDVAGVSLIEAVTLAARLRSFLECMKEISKVITDNSMDSLPSILSYQRPEVQRWINHVV